MKKEFNLKTIAINPVVIGLIVVIVIILIVLQWGPRPAIAPGTDKISTIQPPAPLLESVGLSPMIREYRGWMEVTAKPTITIKAPNAKKVLISYWLVGQENGQWHEANKQADGSWTLDWDIKINQKGHFIVRVIGADDRQEQSDTLNVLVVTNK